jgi:hypothetical protein
MREPLGKHPLGRPKKCVEDTIKMDHKKTGFEDER